MDGWRDEGWMDGWRDGGDEGGMDGWNCETVFTLSNCIT